MGKTSRRLLQAVLVLVVLLSVTAGVGLFLLDEPRPKGAAGPAAEALADKMLEAVHASSWEETGAVRWRMGEGRPLLLWDKERGLVEVTYDGKEPPVRVLLDTGTQDGVALTGIATLDDEAAEGWRERAWADFVNDSFWLNAPAKVRAPGTTRELVELEGGEPALLVRYGSGGVTPGDAYLWELDEDGLPRAWRMWVSILPLGGLRVTWEEWTTTKTGALLATKKVGPLGLTLEHDPLEVAADLDALASGDDPFAPLFQADADTGPASRPTPAADALPWHHDKWAAALAEAKSLRRPLVVDLWAPWCHTCISMQKTVLKDEALTSRADQFVWLALDTDKPENAEALKHMSVSFWPTFYVLDARTRTPLARHVGAATVEQFGALLDEGAEAFAADDNGAATERPAALLALAEADEAAAAGEHQDAADHYRAALVAGGDEWPQRFAVRVELADALLKLGEREACLDLGLARIKDMARAQSASGPDFVGVVMRCAEPLEGRKNEHRREAFLKAATAEDGPIRAVLDDEEAALSADDRSESLRLLRKAYERLGEEAKAREAAEEQKRVLDEAVAATDDPELKAGYAWPREEVYVYLGRGEELVDELTALEEALPESYDVPYRLAWLLHKIGRPDDAAAAIERALEKVYGPRKVRAFQLAARIHQARDDAEAERGAWLDLLRTFESLPPEEQVRTKSALAEAEERLGELGPG